MTEHQLISVKTDYPPMNELASRWKRRLVSISSLVGAVGLVVSLQYEASDWFVGTFFVMACAGLALGAVLPNAYAEVEPL